MKIVVLQGSKEEIIERLRSIDGEIVEAIVHLEEANEAIPPSSNEDIFAEMKPYEVEVGDVDYSRESIYSRTVGE